MATYIFVAGFIIGIIYFTVDEFKKAKERAIEKKRQKEIDDFNLEVMHYEMVQKRSEMKQFYDNAALKDTDSDKKNNTGNKYQSDQLETISLDVSPEFYDELKWAAKESGESIDTFIKTAVLNRIDSI